MSILENLKGMWNGDFLEDPDHVEPAGTFSASLKVNNEVFTVEGATAFEAMRTLAASIPRETMKTKAILSLDHNGRHAEHFLYVIPLRRFLLNKITQDIFAKRLQIALK